MIKNFETYINEDYFSKLVNRKDTGSVRRENEITEDDVMNVIQPEFKNDIKSISFRKENGKTLVDVECGELTLVEDIEEIPFQFGKIIGNFSCEDCASLNSLHGCPESVTGYFDCSDCVNLTSLEGCPKKVGGYFSCCGCENLESLDGCPEKVSGDFDCSDCGTEFSTADVESRCNVSMDIVV